MLNNIKVLLLVLVLLAVASYFVLKQNQSTVGASDQWLIPELQENINQISRIELNREDDTLSLVQTDAGWVVEEANGFYANKENIVGLLMNLRSVVLQEKKTANPDNFGRLELGANATAVRLFQEGQPINAVLIGKTSNTGQGTFVRYADKQQAWLASAVNPINVTLQQWLQKKILDIDATAINAVHLQQIESGESISIRRNSDVEAADAFVLENIPPGQELVENANVGGLANGLANYIIDQAEPKDVSNLNHKITVIYDTVNRLQYLLNIYALNDVYYATVQVQQREGETKADLSTPALAEMQTTNKLYGDWMFVIPSYKFNAINKVPGDYLQAQTTQPEAAAADEGA